MPVNFRFELIERLETARIEGHDELSCIGDLVRLGIEIDAVATKQRTVKRACEQPERQRKSSPFVSRHRKK